MEPSNSLEQQQTQSGTYDPDKKDKVIGALRVQILLLSAPFPWQHE